MAVTFRRIELYSVIPIFVVRAYTTVEWIILARGVHGDKYDYSKVDYKDQYTDVEVICPEHDSLWIQPKMHIASNTSKRGECPICKPGRRVINTSVFIEDAMAVHGNKYDYSKVEYKNNSIKCEIICPEQGHKSFHLTYRSHIKGGTGCRICEVISKASLREIPKEQKPPAIISKPLSPRYNPEFHGTPDTGNRTKEQRKAYREYELAIATAKTDPDNSLNKCRKIAEIYTYSVIMKEKGEVNIKLERELDAAITLCENSKLIPKTTIATLRSLQIWGNLGSHTRYGHEGIYPTYRRIKPALSLAEQLLKDWFDDFVKLEP